MPKAVQLCVTILSNSSKVPSSSRNSMRSRADILPSVCWRSWRSLPPPASASESRRLSSVSFCSRFMKRNYRGSKPLKHGGNVGSREKDASLFNLFQLVFIPCVARSIEAIHDRCQFLCYYRQSFYLTISI